ncbi:hypothetical protein NPIL_135701, partial [Nephila pilipes]
MRERERGDVVSAREWLEQPAAAEEGRVEAESRKIALDMMSRRARPTSSEERRV